MCVSICTRSSEDKFQELVLSFRYVELRDWTLGIRLRSKLPQPLNYQSNFHLMSTGDIHPGSYLPDNRWYSQVTKMFFTSQTRQPIISSRHWELKTLPVSCRWEVAPGGSEPMRAGAGIPPLDHTLSIALQYHCSRASGYSDTDASEVIRHVKCSDVPSVLDIKTSTFIAPYVWIYFLGENFLETNLLCDRVRFKHQGFRFVSSTYSTN